MKQLKGGVDEYFYNARQGTKIESFFYIKNEILVFYWLDLNLKKNGCKHIFFLLCY